MTLFNSHLEFITVHKTDTLETDTEVVEASVVDVVDVEIEEGGVDEVIMTMTLQTAGGE